MPWLGRRHGSCSHCMQGDQASVPCSSLLFVHTLAQPTHSRTPYLSLANSLTHCLSHLHSFPRLLADSPTTLMQPITLSPSFTYSRSLTHSLMPTLTPSLTHALARILTPSIAHASMFRSFVGSRTCEKWTTSVPYSAAHNHVLIAAAVLPSSSRYPDCLLTS